MQYDYGVELCNSKERFFLYVEGDDKRRVCTLEGEFNTKYAAQTLVTILNERTNKR